MGGGSYDSTEHILYLRSSAAFSTFKLSAPSEQALETSQAVPGAL